MVGIELVLQFLLLRTVIIRPSLTACYSYEAGSTLGGGRAEGRFSELNYYYDYYCVVTAAVHTQVNRSK